MSRELRPAHNYTDRLVRLLPAEFVSIYVATTAIMAGDLALRQPVLLAMVGLFVVLIPFYLVKTQGVKSVWQIVVTEGAFLVWTYTLGDAYQAGRIITWDVHNPKIAAVLLLLVTGIPPMFFHPQREDG